jgi:hypothetical protein
VKKFIGILGGAALAAGLCVVGASSAGAAQAPTMCTDTLDPGNYLKVVVPDGATCIIMEGPVNIRAGLTIGAGAWFTLGSEENPVNMGRINGGVHATNPMAVQIHFASINGGIDVQGGSGPFGGPFCFEPGFCPTWTTIEDSHINGGVTIEGYNGFWMGFIRNHVNGSVNLNDNVLVDPDGNEYVTNTINGSLSCDGNSPAPQVGDSEGELNVVNGAKLGQCAAV